MAFSSAELIAALQRRLRDTLDPDVRPGTFPPGWTAWFATMHERAGAITGATADAIVALFVAREPALPPRAGIALNRWRAFNTLWRQQWHPTSEEDRGVRVAAWAITLLVHLLFAVFLVYLAYVRFLALAAMEEERARAGEEVIQVEFIGKGTPQAQGGGPPQGEATQPPVPTPPTAAAASAAAPAPSAQRTPTATPPTPQPQPTPSAPPTPAVAVQQPLQVTETPTPDQAFVLPPPPPIDVPQTRVAAPEFSVPAPTLRTVDVPAPLQAARPREIAAPKVAQPDLQLRPADVAVRDIPAPLAPAQVRDVPLRTAPAPTLSASTPNVARRDVPTPPGSATASASAATPATASSAGTASAPTTAPAGGQPSASSGAQPQAAASGGGRTAAAPGASPSPKRGDDWGASDRNRPGGQAGTPGLFNPDGSPRLVGDGRAGGGLPPGTVTEDFAKIDRNGTWLKRPPTDYVPTSFDKFWVPNETLLQEWVRKSIKEVMIPIPGTSKKIKCAVALLMLGGACGITDPNQEDIEATARKPPDVPFKPELQEDQDSLKK